MKPFLSHHPAWHLVWRTGICAWAVFLLTRITLLAYTALTSDQPWRELLPALLVGSLRDIPVAVAIALPWLVYEILPGYRWKHWLRPPLFAIFLLSLLFVAVSETLFWDEFSTRFNFIAVDYLVYTTEVLGNIRESYPVGPIISTLVLLAVSITWIWRRRLAVTVPVQGVRWQLAMTGGLAVVAVSLVQGQLSAPEFSSNSYANELADNGWRSFVAAARQNRIEYNQFYLTRDPATTLASLQALAGKPAISPLDTPTLQKASLPAQRQPNVVVIMMESMSAEFMATFGNQENLTPNLDRLAREGVFFSRLYATGTRTVRGLEALSAALPPQPGMSVVRWPNLPRINTLGGVLARHGWQPYFIYGGYGAFDNMNGYFASQGYKVVDRTMFREGRIQFENIWGVADEHLFDQALDEFDQASTRGTPFFAHVMTTSNHRPFTYPEGRIDIPSPGGRQGGVKYADYAVGRFLEQARRHPWFDNTVFLIVADHCASSAGKTKLPVEKYHIPAILYAPKLLPARRVDLLASQIDLVPTLLGYLGLKAEDQFIGHDLLASHPLTGRALISTYQNLGYLKDDTLTVLLPKRRVQAYRVTPEGKVGETIDATPALVDEAVAYFQGTTLLMKDTQRGGSNAQ